MSPTSRQISAPSVPVKYSIEDSSPSSGNYGPHNILEDRPDDQRNRWNSTGHGKKWILLKLESLSVVKTITFGKFSKTHPCNMKHFKVYVGATKDNLTEVLHGALKNDTTPETFSLKHATRAGLEFVTRYVKIVPLSTHIQGYNISVWYISMTGITDQKYVDYIRSSAEEYQETTVLRHVLKHLRQRRLLTPFHTILSRSGLQLEHPLISDLHETLVLQGDWPKAERFLESISQASLFDAYLHFCQPHVIWKRLKGTDADGDVPCARSGHAMCIDSANGLIYMLGGYDGQKNLDDFWVYDIKQDKWSVLSRHTTPERNAPGSRSCHKMVFDSKTGTIYVLGGLNDGDGQKLAPAPGGAETQRNTREDTIEEEEAISDCSEFYRYHTRGGDRGRWDFLCFDTETVGGPPVVFDHQIAIDSDAQIIYVFGGRVIDGDWNTIKYAGLYSYNVRLNKWKSLQYAEESTNPSRTIIPSRYGHSMVLEPTTRTLYIFAGQRDGKFLSDMYAYHISTNTAMELYSNFTSSGGPDACFTQRAVIDPQLKEIYVFCGLTQSQQSGSPTFMQMSSPYWLYQYYPKPGRWSEIVPPPQDEKTKRNNKEEEEAEEGAPMSRYAHQVVYDPITKTAFMHGGNGGISEPLEKGGDGDEGEREKENDASETKEKEVHKRLDDFWAMTLARPGRKEVIRKATYQIRQQQFREMCQDMPAVKALGFLQTEVSSVVDHQNPEETEIFRSLLTHLLTSNAMGPTSPVLGPSQRPIKKSRPDTPEEKWTNVLGVQSIDADLLREKSDPEEGEAEEAGKLSGERFKERTELFETLLKYVSKEGKQPEGSLLNMVHLHDVMDSP